MNWNFISPDSLQIIFFTIDWRTCVETYKKFSRNTIFNRCCYRCISRSPSSQHFVLIVDGFSLAFALGEHTEIFRKLCQMCEAVLCCRMSPLQKAEVCTSTCLLVMWQINHFCLWIRASLKCIEFQKFTIYLFNNVAMVIFTFSYISVNSLLFSYEGVGSYIHM